MRTFRLATIEHEGREGAALVVGERLFPLAELAPEWPELHDGVFAVLQEWERHLPTLRALAERADERRGGLTPTDRAMRILTPIRYPRAIFCTVFNFYDFAAEAGIPAPDRSAVRPYVCIKLPHTVIGPDEGIVLPPNSRQVDWEVELGAVIGRPCRNVYSKDALEYLAGYTIVNDVSARDIIQRPDWPNFASDWLVSKNFDTGTPIGPYLLPREFLPDPQGVPLKLTRNGVVQQDGNTSSMIFSVAEQIAFISSVVTLQPGDVIATGTPAGVGWKRGLSLEPGDHLELEVPGIGVLRNTVVAPTLLAPPRFQGTVYA
jgi:2,4-didehydro-3-deoxy-L-rhamnonate hydrolase